MLGQWRVVLRQAEESARAGRFDEALALASRPDVADHRQALLLRARFAQDLVGRAGRRAKADDVAGAAADLDLAERFGAAPDLLAAARLEVADRVADEVRGLLDAGDPHRAAERIDDLARRHVSGPALRRIREAADAWKAALDEARRGEFGRAQEHLDRADRLAGESAKPAIEGARGDLEARRKGSAPRVDRLYEALGTSAWPEILAAAESVLELVPEHPAARQARGRAWQQIAAIHPGAAPLPRVERPDAPAHDIVFLDDAGAARRADARGSATAVVPPLTPREEVRFLPARSPAPPPKAEGRPAPSPDGRFLLWADTLGGFLVCLDDEVVLGRDGPDGVAGVPILGDLSRRHATLVRDGDGYVLRAHQPTFVNDRKVEVTSLRDGDLIRLGASVELEFRQPSPVSATARLTIRSRHRLPMAVQGVLLMAETCILGPSAQAHLPAADLPAPVVLYRQGKALWCRASGTFVIDGRPVASRGPLAPRSSVQGDGFSFSLEPLRPRGGTPA